MLSQERLGLLMHSSVGGLEIKHRFQSRDARLPGTLTKCIIMSLDGQLWAGVGGSNICVGDVRSHAGNTEKG